MTKRRKPSVKVKKKKDFIEIITTFYDKFGKAYDKNIERISR